MATRSQTADESAPAAQLIAREAGTGLGARDKGESAGVALSPDRAGAPVFVVGSARSGNTFLYHLLLSSGHFPQYRTEPVVFDLLVPRFGDFRKRANREKLMKAWVRSKQCRLSGVDVQRFSRRVLDGVSTAGEFLSMIMGEMARTQGVQRWAAWGPDNLLHMARIKREIPNALFVHVIRDGRDVAAALDAKAFIRPFAWDRRERLFVSALHWRWKVQSGRRQRHALGGDYTEVRFEELVLEPQATLGRLGEFIGSPLDYERIRRTQVGAVSQPNTSFPNEVSSGTFAPVGRWQKQLSREKIAQVESLIGDLLEELQYPLSEGPAKLDLTLRRLKAMYPAYFSLKEWLRLSTPLGRLVNVNRLVLQD